MELLTEAFLGKPIWMWLGFLAVVIALLVFDLGVLNRRDHEIGVKESLKLSAFYIIFGLLFGGGIWWWMGQEAGVAYLTGFVVEKTLAMDNIFVIAMIFSYLSVPREYQHRVLFWGILGVIVLRAIMIAAGAALVERFEWVLYIFAAFLVLTGIRLLFTVGKEASVGDNPVLKFVRKHLPVTDRIEGDHFLVREPDPVTGKMKTWLTPLAVALILIEAADIVFAVDSVPAIFTITTDPYIVYTSNIFAILGLRALYFALAAAIHRFHYLKYAMAAVLIFIGSKIFAADALGIAKIPPLISLSVTLGILGAGILYSLYSTRGQPKDAAG
ncbi:TerC family protein [uncultured Sphingomonas sp.]|uniref:TerC family protein n=1 Tax=uncultured Sphingomonas sp. TaxID=158754 RepID=UPI0025F2022E|nr:TerC family protein [uncultured Sphingomonas sp.]